MGGSGPYFVSGGRRFVICSLCIWSRNEISPFNLLSYFDSRQNQATLLCRNKSRLRRAHALIQHHSSIYIIQKLFRLPKSCQCRNAASRRIQVSLTWRLISRPNSKSFELTLLSRKREDMAFRLQTLTPFLEHERYFAMSIAVSMRGMPSRSISATALKCVSQPVCRKSFAFQVLFCAAEIDRFNALQKLGRG